MKREPQAQGRTSQLIERWLSPSPSEKKYLGGDPHFYALFFRDNLVKPYLRHPRIFNQYRTERSHSNDLSLFLGRLVGTRLYTEQTAHTVWEMLYFTVDIPITYLIKIVIDPSWDLLAVNRSKHTPQEKDDVKNRFHTRTSLFTADPKYQNAR